MSDRHATGFKATTSLENARETLAEVISPVERTERVATDGADGRVLAGRVVSQRAVPPEDRAAMDGYAVQAADTFDATDRSPVVLRLAEERLEGGAAVPVHTGSALQAGADAVVPVEVTDVRDETVTVSRAVAVGENVAARGEDVQHGEVLFEAGEALGPAALGVLTSAGVEQVELVDRPRVALVATGEELVDGDPGPGETVATNGLTVARFVERWGGVVADRVRVSDDAAAIGVAIDDALGADLVVTTGGTSVGRRDQVPDVLADRGEVLVHGVGVKPGHPVGFGVVEDTPVLALPGYPVSCLVTAVQFLRPAIAWLEGRGPAPFPSTRATLSGKLESEIGVRTFARVALERTDDGWSATPVRTGGAGVLTSVTEADGWVEVEASLEGIRSGAAVTVTHWEGPR